MRPTSRRIATTSAGLVEIVLTSHGRHGRTAFVSTFDEHGWHRETKRWIADPERAAYIDAANGPFGTFLREFARIPLAEAEDLASKVMAEWEARGGEEQARLLSYLGDAALVVVVVGFLAAAVAVAAVVLTGMRRLARRSGF
jgi:hypothetical protein